MNFVDVFLLILVLVVSVWMARRSSPAASIILFGSGVLISAALFLPSSLLSAVAGTDGLAWMESVALTFSWPLASAAHFVAFLWLALMLWTLRPDLRGWRAIAALVVLAVAAELAQELTVERSARISDVGVNLLGAAVGLLLAVAATRLWKFASDRFGISEVLPSADAGFPDDP